MRLPKIVVLLYRLSHTISALYEDELKKQGSRAMSTAPLISKQMCESFYFIAVGRTFGS